MIELSTPLLTESELAELPVFPLPDAVLFPGVPSGLHVFEPRYRALMRHCLEHGPRAMAIAHLKPGFDEAYEGQPPIYEIAGAGRIVSHRGNPDGTFDLILEGTQRVRLHELPFVAPFRRARAETLVEDNSRAPALVGVIDILARAREATAKASSTPIPPPALRGPPERVLDLLIDHLVRDPRRRQKLLETLDAVERYEGLREVIDEIRGDSGRWKRAN